VNPGVTGKVTLKLNEVPWGRALELILKTNGLGCVLEDNVIRIARLSDLQREEADRRKLDEEKALAGELTDYTRRISYAKAGTLSTVLKQAGALSARGQINIDERTNTIIIRDLPTFVEKAKGLMAELDTATPQVEIEARIVGDEPELLARLRHPVGLRRGEDEPLRQRHEPGVPEPDRRERRRRARRGSRPPTTWARAASRPGPGSARPAAATP
jgi:type IV pilus assembly protein PilQ